MLSWSLLEVMGSGTPVLAEANPMMEELIQSGVNGALWRGDPASLASDCRTPQQTQGVTAVGTKRQGELQPPTSRGIA